MNNFEDSKQSFMPSPIETSYRVNEECSQDDYISQFLGPFPEENPPSVQVEVHSSIPASESEQFEIQSCSESESWYKSKVPSSVKRSPLHNFQKHFVTTIRRNVNIQWPENDEPYLRLAREMWESFKGSKKYTKEFVSLVLGNSDQIVNTDLLKKYGLLNVYKKYDNESFLQAQAFIKNQVILTFRGVPKDGIMYDRRIEKRQEFTNYFFKVLAEIEEGKMNKRLPKKNKKSQKLPKQKKTLNISGHPN